MLHVGVADRAEDLVDALVDHLATPLDDPFQSELVIVPSLGFRSWLRFRLAERLGAAGSSSGIAANIEMPFPGSLRWRILRRHGHLSGRTDDSDPWEVERLVWSVLDVMADPSSCIHPRLRRNELPTGVTLASRAGPIADLFDRYGVHRPEMVRAWATGGDVGPDLKALSPEHRWQPELYRAVRNHVTTAHQGLVPPAERLAEALALVASGELDLRVRTADDPGLPPRLFVVGPSIISS
ncbi:MAG: exodeoxyribonuclease V subunit gamma, partial [Acidimicrobiales bacterium]|nr:exodeoxyribonuclease V subunit gamma [Acidimicrobiales bacterium]